MCRSTSKFALGCINWLDGCENMASCLQEAPGSTRGVTSVGIFLSRLLKSINNIYYKAEAKLCVNICKSVFVHAHSQRKTPTLSKFGTEILGMVFEVAFKTFFQMSFWITYRDKPKPWTFFWALNHIKIDQLSPNLGVCLH